MDIRKGRLSIVAAGGKVTAYKEGLGEVYFSHNEVSASFFKDHIVRL